MGGNKSENAQNKKYVVRQCLQATGLHKQQFLKFLQKSDLK